MNKRRRYTARFFFPALMALLPMLLLAGSVGSAQNAVARPMAPEKSVSTAAQKSTSVVIRVYFRDAAERDLLAGELGAEEVSTAGGFLTVIGTSDTLRDLKARGLRVEFDDAATAELAKVNITWGSDPNTFYGGYNTVEEMQAFLDQMVATYPTLAEKVDIGDSWCKANPGVCTVPNSWNGFDLWVLHITNRDIAGPKPVYWYESGIHSREIATPETAMNFIRLLLDGYNSNPDSHWLVDYHDIWVMPMFNPDGHHMVEAGGNNPYLQRKSGNRTLCTTWPPPGIGIDNNRNFPFKWNVCSGCSSGAPCSETYRGASAGSEIETQAVMNKIRSLVPDQRGPLDTDPAPITTTGIYQSMHSNASLNLYAWGWTTTPSPNNSELANIGQHMEAANADPPGNTYNSCQPGNCLYSVDGDSLDWGYGELGIPSFTTEVGGSGFFPTYSYTQNTIWPQNRGALTYQAKVARTPYLLSHGPDAKLVATNPMTVTQGSPSQLTATINFVWTGNTFSQNVGAAEYYIDTPPWAGGTAIPMNGTFNSPTVSVDATIDTTSIPVGRHIIFVRGRGVNDYQGFQTWGPVSAAWLEVTNPNLTPTLPPTGTSTVPPTITSTTPPTITPTAVSTTSTTPIPCCGNFSIGVLSGCTVNQGTGNPNINVLVEITNQCPQPVEATSGVQLHVSPDGTNWTTFASVPERTVVVPPGPPPYAIQELFLDQNIPPQYNYYRIFSVVREVSGCREYFTMSQTYPICRQSTTATVTLTPTRTGTPTVISEQADLVAEMSYTTVCPAPVLRLTTRNLGFFVPQPSTMRLSNSNGDFREFAVPAFFNGTYSVDCQMGNCVPAGFVTFLPLTLQVDYYNTVGESNEANNTTTINFPPPVPTPCSITPTVTETPCPVQFSDVPSTDTFYANIRCLACRGIVSGYADGTFRPNNQVTRGQLAKMVSNSAGFSEIVVTQTFEDVTPANTFYVWVERLTTRGFMTGYVCGGPGEPCVSGRPYFRPYANATRGQTSKIVSNAAGFNEAPTGQTFQDVPPNHTFYEFIQRLASRGVMGGYECGGPGEPCVGPENRPYFRPQNDVTRGQSAKIVANTFFPGCITP